MDPIERLRASILRTLSWKQLLPWILVIVILAVCLAIIANEQFSKDKEDLNDCVLSSWSEWQGCEGNNCINVGIRSRTVLKQSSRCTKQALVETESCGKVLNCAQPDCQYSTWTEWSDCPNVCFNNDFDCNTLPFQVRFRNVVRTALPGGVPCDWNSLVERRQCVVQQACPPNQDCLVSGYNPELDCNECPDIGCTVSGTSFWTLCTRSILQSASGTGKKCAREQLLYSITCPLPDCGEQCIGNDFGAFAKCSVPCGNGFSVSSDVSSCPSITVGSCSNGSCSTGAFSLTTFTSCSNLNAFCPASDAFSFTQCIASAASDMNLDVILSVSGGLWAGSSSTASCNLNPGGIVWQWNSTSTQCINPTWDMVNAVCLFLCDATNPNTYNIKRGFVFPFTNGSVSCPVNPYMLSISNVCPLTNATAARPMGVAQWQSMLQDFTRTITDASGVTYTVSCPASADCLYQSWSDAPVWDICQNPCATGGGTRFRFRSILTPPVFLGDACNPAETVEEVPCNSAMSITSASEMWCNFDSLTMLSRTSEFKCFQQCSATRAESLDNTCNSIFLMQRSHTEGQREIFLASVPSLTPFNSVSAIQFLQSFTSGPLADSSAQIATFNELVDAFDMGGQSCLQGWFQNPTLTLAASVPLPETVAREREQCPATLEVAPWLFVLQSMTQDMCFFTNASAPATQTQRQASACPLDFVPVSLDLCSRTKAQACPPFHVEQDGVCLPLWNVPGNLTTPVTAVQLGAVVQQDGCGGNIDTPGVFVALPGTQSPYVWISSTQKALLYSKSDLYGSFDLQPFFSATSATNSPLSSAFEFTSVQSFSDEIACGFEPHRTDKLLLAHSCTSLTGKPLSQSLTLNAGLIDVPCDLARDCSLTAWADFTQCGPCRPPDTFVQTRSVVARATEGGNPCENFALVQSVPCPQSLPVCTSSGTFTACIANQFPQKSGTGPNACDALTQTFPFIEAWNEFVILPWAQLGASITGVLQNLTKMQNGSAMPNDLAVALNAQPVDNANAAPLCVIGVDPVTRTATSAYEFSISNLGVALGWKASSCIPTAFVTDTILDRTGVGYATVSYRVFDFTTSNWICPSICPYTSQTCVFLPAGSCSCGELSQTAFTGWRNWGAGSNLTCTQTGVAETFSVPCPNPYGDCASISECPIGCDGSPCGSASGWGVCSLTNDPMVSPFPFYECACSNGSTQKDCSNDCPLGNNGQVCSGRGTCSTANGLCTCNPGFSGFACEQWGSALVGMVEGLLMQAQFSYTAVTTSTTFTETITVTNKLPCEDQNNPACTSAQFIFSGVDANLFQVPILSQVNVPSALVSANMCVNSGDAMLGQQWIPGFETMLSVGSLSCASFSALGENFSITAVFVENEGVVPPWLVGKQFNLRCMQTSTNFSNGGIVFTYFRPQQTASNGKPIFEIVGQGTRSFDDVCNGTF